MATDQKVQFIAMEAVAQMITPECAEQMDEESEHNKNTGEQQGGAQRRSRENRHGGFVHCYRFLDDSLRDCTQEKQGRFRELLFAEEDTTIGHTAG